MVDEPSGLLLKQTAIGVDMDGLMQLHSAVSGFAQPRCMVEEPSCEGLKKFDNQSAAESIASV